MTNQGVETRPFDKEEQQLIVSELNKLQRTMLDHLDEHDEDEDVRASLDVISCLKNVVKAGYLDNLIIEFNWQIINVDVD